MASLTYEGIDTDARKVKCCIHEKIGHYVREFPKNRREKKKGEG